MRITLYNVRRNVCLLRSLKLYRHLTKYLASKQQLIHFKIFDSNLCTVHVKHKSIDYPHKYASIVCNL